MMLVIFFENNPYYCNKIQNKAKNSNIFTDKIQQYERDYNSIDARAWVLNLVSHTTPLTFFIFLKLLYNTSPDLLFNNKIKIRTAINL